MSVSLDSYRSAIGIWHHVSFARNSKPKKTILSPIKVKLLLAFILSTNGVFIGALLLLRCGDVHPNPGPVQSYVNKSLNLCHINIQSLYLVSEKINPSRKINEIESLIMHDLEMDLVCLSETWLKPHIIDSDVKIEGYDIERKDRIGVGSGGVGMYITNSLPYTRRKQYEIEGLELLWVEIELGNKKIFVGSCYRPNGQNVEEVDLFMSNFQDSLERIFRRNPSSIIIMGDFNDVCTTWDSDHRSSELGLKLYDYINGNDLHQTVLEPTHISPEYANILDLIITDSPGYIIKQKILPPLGSRHQIVSANFSIQYRRDKIYTREIWSYRNGDFEGLINELTNTPWQVGFELFEDIDDIADFWLKSFMDACKSKIPNRIIKVRPMDKPWITNQVKMYLRIRNRKFKRFKRTKLHEHEVAWKMAVREANYYMHHAKLAHVEKIKTMLTNLSVGEKKYWKIAKEVYGSKKTIGIPALKDGNKSITTSLEKSECLNNYFAIQQTQPPLRFNQQLAPIQFLTESRIESIQTTKEEVLKILKGLDIGKATGPDGVSNRLLKETSLAISEPLSILFNKSFELGKVPKIWKEANLSPIFKKDDKTLVNNYRPISLLSCIGKVQERVVYMHLYKYLKENRLLTWKNSGFKELDSAINQLLFIVDKIHKALEAGKEICLVFLDVSKAFDRVWHSGLLHKARCMGIEGRLFDWLCNYLSDRKIRVVLNGQKSEWKNTTAGVPQGSILGPLLFLIFVNDITDGIETDIHLFADDTSLMEIIENYNDSYAKMNRDLQRLNTWADKWLVTFNAAKTVYLKISRKVNAAPNPILQLNGENIKEVNSHKHLGLIFNDSLTWSNHIDSLVTKASKCVGLLRRICYEVPRDCLETLYKSMILPILEYGDIIYDGSSDLLMDRLEKVQRHAAITCTGAYKHTKHTKLLEELGWPPLSQRRKQHRMNVMFKLQHGLLPPYLTKICPPLTKERTTYDLRSGMNITTPQMRTTTYQQSYFPKSIKDWNELEMTARACPSIESFKEYHKKRSGFRVNPLFRKYSSKAAINHTRIRLGLSGLSSQRHDYNHIDNPKCLTCNAKCEDPAHYFLLCPSYEAARADFLEDLCQILHANSIEVDFNRKSFVKAFIDMILNGTELLSEELNLHIFLITQAFINESNRFP